MCWWEGRNEKVVEGEEIFPLGNFTKKLNEINPFT